MRAIQVLALVGGIGLAPAMGFAEDVALIVAGGDYRRLPDIEEAGAIDRIDDALAAAGFRVITARNEDLEEVLDSAVRFRQAARGAERVVVVLAGHVLSGAGGSWLLTRRAQSPSDLSIGTMALPLAPLLDTLAAHAGQAVMLVAPSGEEIEAPGLVAGTGDMEPPQGVALIVGPHGTLAALAGRVLGRPGASWGGALEGAGDSIEARGFLPEMLPFLPAPTSAAGGTPGPTPAAEPDMEAAFWQVARAMASVAGYEAYLDTYPRGRFAAAARDAMVAIEANAVSRAEATEDALGLDRERRREIQRDLSILGHDPRGIDGIFGGGTRAAIAAWQATQGYEPTGFVDSGQLAALAAAAEARAQILAEEAAARRAEEERRDQAYWRDTGRGGDEAGLRAYLERFPDGLYAEVAQTRLDEIEAAARAAAAAEERAAWDQVRAADTADAYAGYLRTYPRGAFADAARARLAELEEEAGQAADVAAAKAEERQVAGNPVVQLLVEQRLAALGFDVGAVDGSFDKGTRRAIRRFQRSRDIEVSGFVTRETMAHLLAGRR